MTLVKLPKTPESAHLAYRQIVDAAGLSPDVDLTAEAQVVLAELAELDPNVVAGLVEIVGAARQVEKERRETFQPTVSESLARGGRLSRGEA